MTKLQWAGVIGALGFGVLAQIPNHDDQSMPGHEPQLPAAGGENVVSLAISGMT
jgi:hypothetical protein